MQNLRAQGFDPQLTKDSIILDEALNVHLSATEQLTQIGMALCYIAFPNTVTPETFADMNCIEDAQGYQLIKLGGQGEQIKFAIATTVFISNSAIKHHVKLLHDKYTWYARHMRLEKSVTIKSGLLIKPIDNFVYTDNKNYDLLYENIRNGLDSMYHLGMKKLFICYGEKIGLGMKTSIVQCMTNLSYNVYTLHTGENFDYNPLAKELSENVSKACILVEKTTSNVLLKNDQFVFENALQRLLAIADKIPVVFCTSILNPRPITPFITYFSEIKDSLFIAEVIKARLPYTQKYHYDFCDQTNYANPLNSLLLTIKLNNDGIQ